MMRGLQKSKRISWAPDVTLCETKLFLKDDSPSQVGSGSQDDLQAKSSLFSHSSRSSVDDNLPPGFEGAPSANQNQIQVLEISQIKWKFPPKFELNPDWQVVAGGESNEMEIENQREVRVLEAVYPRLSAIPPNPVFPMDPEGFYDENQTPLIPMNPIEDEDVASDCISPNVPISSQPPNPNASSNVEPDIARAAYAAVAAITKGNEHGNLIDNDLLVKILSDPKLIEKLLVDHGTSQNVPLSNPPVPIHNPSSFIPSGQFYPPLQNGGPRPSSSVGPKDVNYYKNLIQQHGGERQQTQTTTATPQQQFGNRFNHDNNNIPPPQFSNRFGPQLGEMINSSRPRDPSKPKINKPCMYFNSSRGCRNGASCPFQHDASSQQQQQQRGNNNSMPEGPAAKRMKIDREISS